MLTSAIHFPCVLESEISFLPKFYSFNVHRPKIVRCSFKILQHSPQDFQFVSDHFGTLWIKGLDILNSFRQPRRLDKYDLE